jgi:hypothetical protein
LQDDNVDEIQVTNGINVTMASCDEEEEIRDGEEEMAPIQGTLVEDPATRRRNRRAKPPLANIVNTDDNNPSSSTRSEMRCTLLAVILFVGIVSGLVAVPLMHRNTNASGVVVPVAVGERQGPTTSPTKSLGEPLNSTLIFGSVSRRGCALERDHFGVQGIRMAHQ